MKELQLKYGCNPNQSSARVYMKDGSDLPAPVILICSTPSTAISWSKN